MGELESVEQGGGRGQPEPEEKGPSATWAWPTPSNHDSLQREMPAGSCRELSSGLDGTELQAFDPGSTMQFSGAKVDSTTRTI